MAFHRKNRGFFFINRYKIAKYRQAVKRGRCCISNPAAKSDRFGNRVFSQDQRNARKKTKKRRTGTIMSCAAVFLTDLLWFSSGFGP
jgi:hypothetical protein